MSFENYEAQPKGVDVFDLYDLESKEICDFDLVIFDNGELRIYSYGDAEYYGVTFVSIERGGEYSKITINHLYDGQNTTHLITNNDADKLQEMIAKYKK